MTHPQAEKIAPAVQYEWDMFIATAAALNREDMLGGALPNALLESFLIHARIMKDFFFGTPTGDDVSAKHFFDNEEDWSFDFEKECPYLKANVDRLNKSVAHLSYKRIGYRTDKNWYHNRICKELSDMWDCFLKSLSPERRHWFPFPKERAS